MSKPKLSVQQQNQATYIGIKDIAHRFSSGDPALSWLRHALTQEGFSATSGLLVRYQVVPEEGGDFCSGIWLTASKEFWAFAATVSCESSGKLDLERLENVTAEFPLSAHQRGRGKSFGWLALDVLQTINLDTTRS